MSSLLRVLILGGGGREHALAWKISQSPRVEQIFVAPGNAGTGNDPKCSNINISVGDFPKLVSFAVEKRVNLVIPGPEQPLVDGVEAVFRKVGIPVFGPSAQAARMEGSKGFSKDFMSQHNIPTAQFRIFTSSQYEHAVNFVKTAGFRVVLKADGLAAGKGVLIPETVEEALEGLDLILRKKAFGDAGNEVVIEEYLEGPELSVLAFSDGYTILPLPAGQDHKRIGENDTGPNTGGMGVYAPAPVATSEVTARIQKEVLQPTIDGMRRDGWYRSFPFVGMLFTGFILTASGPKVLEYNVRFGDPETEALMLLLDDKTDLALVLLAAVEHRLDSVSLSFRPGFAVSVVIASQGYPGNYPKDQLISIGKVAEGVGIFHAGTAMKDGLLVTSGGRVIAVAAYGATLQDAIDAAYAGVQQISFEGMVYRRDIAHRALKAPQAQSTGLTYAAAGVSVDAGNSLVEHIKPFVKKTARLGSDASIGGFGGTFDLKAIGYTDPVLVSGTDGVGTKLKVAMKAGIHDTIGVDLVAMSVNDLIVQGAEPLYFLDYYGCSKLDVDLAADVIKGVAAGCSEAGCALIGGETAEMPGMYSGGEYDLAGFAVGAVERHLILPRDDIAVGDFLIGLPSSGFHSNGYSLIRKIIDDKLHLNYASPCPWDTSRTLSQALLEPTRIYIKQLLPAVREGLVKGMAHITGGGFTENIPRILPSHLGCSVDVSRWSRPPCFSFLQKHGDISSTEMARTFNNGIGMVAVVSPDHKDAFIYSVESCGLTGLVEMGSITNAPGVQLLGLSTWNPAEVC